MNKLRFALAFHNHQPVGNFEGTIEDAYQHSYLPFLELFSQPEYASLKLSLHHSGCLAEWLDLHHPEYLEKLAKLAEEGRIEILGGPFQEPILAMLPSRDRIGQVQYHSQWLEKKLGVQVQGMWMPERVWEQNYVEDLVAAGIRYTIVDDYHFKRAGLKEEQLFGYYVTEDDGCMMKIFPGSEKLRYWIPFHEPEETIQYFQHVREVQPNAVMVFGDDGEKFGSWPGTFKHVYEDGWLKRFLDALVENEDWLQTVTLKEAVEKVPPLGKCYLPDCSYREMTEWSLPVERLVEYEQLVHEMPDWDPMWQKARPFMTGGTWRNFKVKYPETNEMYARMMSVSENYARMLNVVEHSRQTCLDNPGAIAKMRDRMELVQQELYRGQCNCSYWHGAFGGVYLPHLRNGVYQHLIQADNLLRELGDVITGTHHTAVSTVCKDFNFDGFNELRIADRELIAWLAPHQGGMLYELDIRRIAHNLLATLARRPEAYHVKVRQGSQQNDNCASIHEMVHFKQEGLEKRLQYDDYLRKSLLDLFIPNGTTFQGLLAGETPLDASFVKRHYEATVDESNGKTTLKTTGTAKATDGTEHEIAITKIFSMVPTDGVTICEFRYRLENLPLDAEFQFGVEMNFAGMPGGCDDRFFYKTLENGDREPLGNLSTRLELADALELGLVDEWLKLDVCLKTKVPAEYWAYPVETVSNSEGGFESVHQSVAVFPHWNVKADENGVWENTLRLEIQLGARNE